ncbi:MAG: hypothetical protein AAF490_22365 [Chloroflexota bacterium]
MVQNFDTLKTQLNRWNGRRRLRDGLLWVPRGVLAGLLLSAVLATLSRFRPLVTNDELLWWAGGLMIGGLLITLGIVLLQRRTLIQKARFADRQFGLMERTSTAVEIHEHELQVPPVMAEQQLQDTLTAVDNVNTRQQLPLQIEGRDWSIILVGLLLLFMSWVLENPQSAVLTQQRTVNEAITEEIAELEALQEEILQNPDLTEEQQEELVQPLESAIEELQEGNLSQEEAVATLSEAEANLRELGNDNDQSDLQDALQSAGQPLANNANSQQLGENLQNGNLSQAGAEASSLADQLPQLSQQEQQDLAQDLAETAASLAGTDSQLSEQLNRAAEALANGDTAAAQEALQEASATLQQRAQENAAAQQAEGAASQLNESRQDVAQAGQEGQEGQQGAEGQQGQQGQAGQGEGQGEGQGQGQGEGQGEGSGGEGAGSGGSGLAGGEELGAGGSGAGGGSPDTVFVPNPIEINELSESDGVDIELPAECISNPETCGGLLGETDTEFTDEQSVVPYDQVFGDYRDSANEALSDDYIPLGLKGTIREYFSSLEPEG